MSYVHKSTETDANASFVINSQFNIAIPTHCSGEATCRCSKVICSSCSHAAPLVKSTNDGRTDWDIVNLWCWTYFSSTKLAHARVNAHARCINFTCCKPCLMSIFRPEAIDWTLDFMLLNYDASSRKVAWKKPKSSCNFAFFSAGVQAISPTLSFFCHLLSLVVPTDSWLFGLRLPRTGFS